MGLRRSRRVSFSLLKACFFGNCLVAARRSRAYCDTSRRGRGLAAPPRRIVEAARLQQQLNNTVWTRRRPVHTVPARNRRFRAKGPLRPDKVLRELDAIAVRVVDVEQAHVAVELEHRADVHALGAQTL